MKILGISCGSVMGNSEIMLRKALMDAEKAGAEVELIRINDFFLAPCSDCGFCEKDGADLIHDCVYEDDFPAVAKAYADCDGLIISFPVYNWSPPGQLKVLADRFGAHYNVARLRAKAADGGADATADGSTDGSAVDARFLKKRPVAFISVAGAMDEHYYSMGLGPAVAFAYDLGLTPIDQLMCGFSTDKGHCLKHEDKIAHAGRIGEEIVAAVSSGDFSWKGEEGTCPVCHNNMMILKDGRITCPFCGVEGAISYDGAASGDGADACGGAVRVDFSQADFSVKRTDDAQMLAAYEKVAAEKATFAERKASLAEKSAYYQNLSIPEVSIGNGYQRKEG